MLFKENIFILLLFVPIEKYSPFGLKQLVLIGWESNIIFDKENKDISYFGYVLYPLPIEE